MAFSPPLGSSITNTRMRTPDHLSPFSGMCAVCTAQCTGMCEIGLSALRGSEAIYPYQTDVNQFASEKNYPLDFSHLNINGRVFGAFGCAADADLATFPNVDINSSFGLQHPVPLLAPIVLPAMAKLNWRDYFAGAALAGVVVVIGEDVVAKDKELELVKGRVHSSPLLAEMVGAFRQHYRGYGDIVLQANWDDEQLGVLDYAITTLGVESVELKFGQAAKGIQGMGRVEKLEDAIKFKQMGYLVHPDPSNPEIAAAYARGVGPVFEKIGKLPMWDMASLVARVRELRELGAKRVCFKTGPFDPADLLLILRIASEAGVDLVTFDGAGGGSGNSPSKMMNEWGIPTIELESAVYAMLVSMKSQGAAIPQVAIAGGIAMEDQVFKALALGEPHIPLVGIGRAAMAAAMVGKQIGAMAAEGNVPRDFARFGDTATDLFSGYRELRAFYGDAALDISCGAVGLYSYLGRISAGLKQLMALNRKFTLAEISRRDVVPLTAEAARVTRLCTYTELCEQEL
jgi:hypothetical protein